MANTQPHHPRSGVVFQTIKGKILSGEYGAGERLPSLTKLAREFRLSRWTVSNALGSLEGEGLVIRKARSGVYTRTREPLGAAATLPSLRAPLAVADRVVQSIKEGIGSGQYQYGNPLPQKKEFCHIHRCAKGTIAKAFRKLENQGWIHFKGSTAFVGPDLGLRRRFDNKRIFLIYDERFARGFSELRAVSDFLSHFEAEVASAGVPLEFVGRTGNGFSRQILRQALGYLCILSFTGAQDLQAGRNTEEIRPLKAGLRSRLSGLVYSVGHLDPSRVTSRAFAGPRLTFLSADNRQAGDAVGKYLAMQGHGQIGFFSYSTGIWNRIRRDAVADAFRRLRGGSGMVHEFAAGVDKESFIPAEPFSSRRNTRVIRTAVERLFGGYRFQENRGFQQEAGGKIYKAISADHHRRKLVPLFRKALKKSSTTGWVCADPTVALVAHEFLGQHGPKTKIALVSIDDDPYLAALRIPAFNFQFGRLGYLAAHRLLGDVPVRVSKNRLLASPGQLIER